MPVYLAEHSSVPLGKGEARQLVSFPEGTHEDVTRTFVNGGYRASQMYLPSRALNALIQSWQWVALVFSMATFLLVLGGLHRRRLQQVERQFNMRLEERLHERTPSRGTCTIRCCKASRVCCCGLMRRRIYCQGVRRKRARGWKARWIGRRKRLPRVAMLSGVCVPLRS